MELAIYSTSSSLRSVLPARAYSVQRRERSETWRLAETYPLEMGEFALVKSPRGSAGG